MVLHRIVTAAFALLLSVAAASAQSVHTLPVGSVFEGKVAFARSEVPLPPGKWTLASAGEEKSTGDLVVRLPFANLVQIDGSNLSALVTIFGTLSDDRNGWGRDANCDRSDMLYAAADKNYRTTDQWCSYVQHSIRSWTATDQTPPKAATLFAYLRQENVKKPWTMLAAATRLVRNGEFIAVTYEVDPLRHGGPATKIIASQTSEWNPQRIQDFPAHRAYADKWIEWSKPLLDSVKEGFGRTLRVAGLPPFPKMGLAAMEVRLAQVGTRFVTENGGFRVQAAEGTAVTMVNARNLSLQWQVGGLVPVASNRQIDRDNAERILPLKVGNKAVFERAATVSAYKWRHTMEVVGTEILSIDGRNYTTFVVEDRVEGLTQAQKGFVMKRTAWFSPEAGWLLRLAEEQLGGEPTTLNSWRVVKIVPPGSG
ncbi:MAG: hypothetical protein ING44_10600 [Telmatospirillum sp.]|nr:hypothetical protein [Telmatospirillum sp.]